MINIDFELDRLRNDLKWNGVDMATTDNIVNLARQDVHDAINDIVDNAMLEAAQIGEAMGADDFVGQLQVMRENGTYHLRTLSGKTDFSEPPFPMLPKLLKNAETSKDGVRYKRIPIADRTRQAAATNIFDMRARANQERRQEVQARKQERDNARKSGSFRGTTPITGLSKAKAYLESRRQGNANIPKGAVTFRTATSNQDPETQWVRPGKDKDMTGVLRDINDRIDQDIEAATMDIINQYKELI